MTERDRGQLTRDASHLQIGPSHLRWDGETLVIEIREITSPWPSRVRGVVRLHGAVGRRQPVALAPDGSHQWWPIAPSARVEVDMLEPTLRWSGAGYLDANLGDAPLEQSFTHWDWSRAHLPGQRSQVVYDVDRVGAPPLHLGLDFDADGNMQAFDPPPATRLAATGWRLPRTTRCDAGAVARVARTWTDAPFYARSLVETQWLGMPVTTVHESLSLNRFKSPWVQAMLPFRMPRRTR
jgi:carotenoid 1,2-hydratase